MNDRSRSFSEYKGLSEGQAKHVVNLVSENEANRTAIWSLALGFVVGTLASIIIWISFGPG